MKCPNCGHENMDGAAECLNCQVIFSKLKERKETPQHEPSPGGPAAGKTSPLPKILIVLAVASAAAWYFLKPAAKQEAAPAAAETGQPAAVVQAGATQPAEENAAPAAPQNQWKFEGTVIDLLLETPVEGAALKFYSGTGGETFQAVTNSRGGYSLDLKPLEKGGYGVFITHPNYGNQHWDAGDAKKSMKERCRRGQAVQFVSPGELTRHVGSAGGVSIYDFAVYPNSLEKLEEKQRAECYSGIAGR